MTICPNCGYDNARCEAENASFMVCYCRRCGWKRDDYCDGPCPEPDDPHPNDDDDQDDTDKLPPLEELSFHAQLGLYLLALIEHGER